MYDNGKAQHVHLAKQIYQDQVHQGQLDSWDTSPWGMERNWDQYV